MKEDYFNQVDDYEEPFCEQQCTHGSCFFVCSNSNPSIQTFGFSTQYASIPHDLLKSRMNSIINNAFKYKNGATRYTHITVGRNKSYFTSDPLNGDNKYPAYDICKMIEFLVDNIYVRFGGQLSDKWLAFLWEQTVPHYWLTCFSIPTKMSF